MRNGMEPMINYATDDALAAGKEKEAKQQVEIAVRTKRIGAGERFAGSIEIAGRELTYEVVDPEEDTVHIKIDNGETVLLDLVTDINTPISKLPTGAMKALTIAISKIDSAVRGFKSSEEADKESEEIESVNMLVKHLANVSGEKPTITLDKHVGASGNVELTDQELVELTDFIEGKTKIEPIKEDSSKFKLEINGSSKRIAGLKYGDYVRLTKIADWAGNVASGSRIAGELLTKGIYTGVGQIFVGTKSFGPTNWTSDVMDIEDEGHRFVITTRGGKYELVK